MTQAKESEMDTNENIRNDTSEEVIVLGVASIETKGDGFRGEVPGTGAPILSGISEE
jgi:hypothetical protein